MKEIITYFHYLLHEEGKAVLPGLGILTAHYKPAEADLGKDRFSPPQHRLQFSDVKEDAAATIRQISALSSKTEPRIKQALDEYVSELKSRLDKEGVAEMEGLGVLHRNKSGQLRFEADAGFNKEGNAFGLEVFHLKKQAAPQPEKEEPAPRLPSPERETPEPLKQEKRKPSKKTSSSALIIGLTLIIITGFGFLAFSYYFDPPAYLSRYMKPLPQLQAQTDVPFADTADQATAGKEADEPILPDTAPGVTDSMINAADTLPTAEDQINDAKEDTGKSTEQQEAVKQDMEEKFFIVAGLFRTDKGVQGMIGRLSEKGYPAKVFRTNARGIHYVCYAGYPDRESAENALKKIRETEDPQAWIWPKNQ
jgi:hypothetical protein